MKMLITGHTGFKGSWLSLMLKELGHELYGYSLSPLKNSLFEATKIENIFLSSCYSDIRNREILGNFISEIQPELIIHLAAQPLVRYSYDNPSETFTVNVDGTLNVLEASEDTNSVKIVLIVTTDKVYKSTESGKPFREVDPLGEADPYSTSKAMSDLLAQSWGKNISSKRVLIARAGNVIGGGDFASDRIVPDLITSIKGKSIPSIRNPNSVRPWQHVLDCIHGYLKLISYDVTNTELPVFNFGPHSSEYRTVGDLTNSFLREFGLSEWKIDDRPSLPETQTLALDSSLAMEKMGWKSKLDFNQSVEWTARWYKRVFEGERELDVTKEQIFDYLNLIAD